MKASRLLYALLACAIAALVFAAGPALADDAWWNVTSDSAPTNLAPGTEAAVIAIAVNAGHAPVIGSEENKIVLKDTLPAGLEIVSAEAKPGPQFTASVPKRDPHPLKCPHLGQVVTCEWNGPILASEAFQLKTVVKVSPSMSEGTAPNVVEIGGGLGAKADTLNRALQISKEPTKFGVENYEIRAENDEGGPETQAGAHPFQLTTNFDTNQIYDEVEVIQRETLPDAPALPENLHFVLPPGLIGKASKLPRCTQANFSAYKLTYANLCNERSAIGVAAATVTDPTPAVGWKTITVPVFNIEPSPGEPARFGFAAYGIPVVLTTHVRSGSDYGVEVAVHQAPNSAAVLQSQLTLWGVPMDPGHDSQRGWECLQEGWWVEQEIPCKTAAQLEKENHETGPESFLTMPTYCATTPVTTADGEAWNGVTFGHEGQTPVKYEFTPFTGCGALPFEPSIEVETDHHEASTPSGMTVKVKVNQDGTVSGKEGAIADATIAKTTLALPRGVQASAGAADGLLTCTSKGFGFNGGEAAGHEADEAALLENNHFDQTAIVDELEGEPVTECPKAAKIGTVNIKSPLLEEELTGGVYLASENIDPLGVNTPFTSKLVLYIFAESKISKVQVKLAGSVQITEEGQLVSTFDHTPPVAFSELTLHLNDGPRASESTPEECGTSQPAVAEFETAARPKETTKAEDTFDITSGPGGSPCPAPGTQPFAPGFDAKSESPGAGEFSPFIVTLERPDGQQALKSVTVTQPPGVSAMISSVNRCPIALAKALPPACPAESQVGESTAIAGLGSDHVSIPGKVYLTDSPAPGVPFGLLSVSDATHVGVFDLGEIAVMSNITVNETTAQATVTSEAIPQYAPFVNEPGTSTGLPAQIHQLRINVNRPGFTFNPTNCNELQGSYTLKGYGPGGSEGSVSGAYPYHAANCGALPFKPRIAVELETNVSRLDGTGMHITVEANKGDANIGQTKLEFPTVVPARLPTLHKACLDSVFNVNPAGCSPESVVGTATAYTPVLKSPLIGPVYLVSHGNAAFPDSEIVLQGEGVRLLLDGKTFIPPSGPTKGVTSSTFETIPDAPVTKFEVSLPRGPHSAFSGFGDLCTEKPTMPSFFTGQNGAKLTMRTQIKLLGCGAVLPTHVTALQNALKACKKLSNKTKRANCERAARLKYALIACHKQKVKKKRAKCETAARKKYAVKKSAKKKKK
jgi:hypothetical protein